MTVTAKPIKPKSFEWTQRNNDTLSLKQLHKVKQEIEKEIPNAIEKMILYTFYERLIKEMNEHNRY